MAEQPILQRPGTRPSDVLGTLSRLKDAALDLSLDYELVGLESLSPLELQLFTTAHSLAAVIIHLAADYGLEL